MEYERTSLILYVIIIIILLFIIYYVYQNYKYSKAQGYMNIYGQNQNNLTNNGF